MSAGELSPRDALWRMTNSYQVSQAINAAATLGIADLLVDGLKSPDELAKATGAHAPSLYRLLRALASVGLFAERDDGSFVSTRFFEAVTEGADAYLLKSVIHDWDDAAATQILRNKCRAAMRDTGKVLLVERVVRPVNEPDPAKFSDPNMLVELGGRERTAEEFGRLYAEAGFRFTDVVPMGSPYHIIEGAPV
jgi:hypothetical protein